MLSLNDMLVFLIVTAIAIPAYTGAGVGWDSAHISGKDPIEGAGTGAFRAMTIDFLAAIAIAVVLLLANFLFYLSFPGPHDDRGFPYTHFPHHQCD